MAHTSSKRVVPLLCLLFAGGAALAAPQVDVQSGAQAVPSLSFASYQPSVVRYVDGTNGNDNNPGDEGTPWKTLGKAVRSLQPGQAAVVRYGVYQEHIQWSAVGAANGTFDTTSGTCTAPIILRGAPGSRPIVEALSAAPLFHVDRACWIIEGFWLDLVDRSSHVVRFDSANSHNNILRNSIVMGSGGGAGVSIQNFAHDISLIDNVIHSNLRTAAPTTTSCWSHSDCKSSGMVCATSGFCAPRMDSHGVSISPDTSRILIRGNEMYDNSGDGVQCVGPVHSDPRRGTNRPSDITIEDNHIYNTFYTHGFAENAVDIKDCDRVTIRGGRFHSFRPTNNTSGDKDDGIAIIAHYDAQGIRVEEVEIWDACRGIGLGHSRTDLAENLANVTIHHNVIYNGVKEGTESPLRCSGDGIRVGRLQNADIYNNTLRNLPGTYFAAGQEYISETSGLNIDLFNNIFTESGNGTYWLGVAFQNLTDFESSYNLFPSDTSLRFRCNMETGNNLAYWRSCPTFGRVATRDPAGQTQVGAPIFSNWGRHYLTASSPGRDVALPIAGARTCGSGQDMGARESGCSAMPAELGWRHQDGTSAAESFLDAVVDRSGNVYAVGKTAGSLAGPFAGGGADGILRKYSASGTVQWTRQLGRAGADEIRGVAVAPSGDVYVAGVSVGNQVYNALIASYDASGNLRTDSAGNPWIRYLVTTTQTEGFQSVAVDSAGYIYAAGFRMRNYLPFARLAKFTPDGTLLWDRDVGGIGTLDNVVVDAAGNIFASFSSDEEFRDAVVKIASTGQSGQALQYFEGSIRAMALDAAGNIVVAGETNTDEAVLTHVNRGGTDAFVAKLTPQNVLLWSHQPGTSSNDRGYAVAVDAQGDVLLIGETSGPLNGTPHAGREDMFVSKYSSAGSHVWTRLVGTFDGAESAQGGGSDGSGGAIVCGSVSTAVFGPLAGSTDVACARIASP